MWRRIGRASGEKSQAGGGVRSTAGNEHESGISSPAAVKPPRLPRAHRLSYLPCKQTQQTRACVALAGCVVAAALSGTSAVLAEEGALLTRMLREGQSFHVRAGAAALMGQRRDARGRPVLEGALGDSHPTVRAAAANALGRIGSTESLPPLQGAAQDRVRTVAVTAKQAIQTIETRASRDLATDATDVAYAQGESVAPRFGLMLGAMLNQSAYVRPEVNDALGAAVQRQLSRVPGVVVFDAEQTEQLQDALGKGLTVFRLDASVTALSTVMAEGRLSVHCEVALLVIDRPTGSLRSLIKGAARAVEIANGDPDQQQLGVARRVVAGAVRSALRNADSTLAVAVR